MKVPKIVIFEEILKIKVPFYYGNSHIKIQSLELLQAAYSKHQIKWGEIQSIFTKIRIKTMVSSPCIPTQYSN